MGSDADSREGPIRSRLVHDGFLNDADAHLNARQGGGQQQDNTEQQARAAGPASTSARPARTVVG